LLDTLDGTNNRTQRQTTWGGEISFIGDVLCIRLMAFHLFDPFFFVSSFPSFAWFLLSSSFPLFSAVQNHGVDNGKRWEGIIFQC
jgi:hypothetical protein